jgi:tRNA G18 (ribose-2'-O)-methylase SpoU
MFACIVLFIVITMRRIILIAHDIRSTHNVGSLLRTAEGLGVKSVYLTGYSPYPRTVNDNRLPHIYAKLDKQIHKTALGAEDSLSWHYREDIFELVMGLRQSKYKLVALEQNDKSIDLGKFKFESCPSIALIVGNEVKGLDKKILDLVDSIVEIPMRGSKESLNVVQAAAIALYVFTA